MITACTRIQSCLQPKDLELMAVCLGAERSESLPGAAQADPSTGMSSPMSANVLSNCSWKLRHALARGNCFAAVTFTLPACVRFLQHLAAKVL